MQPEMTAIPAYRDSLEAVGGLPIPWERLRERRVLITGATGMIGSVLVDLLMARSKSHVVAMGRSTEAARARFPSHFGTDRFSFLCQDVSSPMSGDMAFDYIVHAAGNAHPAAYARDPVGTMHGAYLGAMNLLEYGLRHGIRRFLMVSSGEVYGQPAQNMAFFPEEYSGYVDPSRHRSCYPSAMRAAETLCAAYLAQYGLDTVVARPCHIYGPSQTAGDSRAVSQFFRAAAAGEDIVLKSRGEQVRSYCYAVDAASALVAILLTGARGEAYNIASHHSTVSIAQLADMIASAAGVSVRFETSSEAERAGYTLVTRGVLGGKKLEALGWRAQADLPGGIAQTLAVLRARA